MMERRTLLQAALAGTILGAGRRDAAAAARRSTEAFDVAIIGSGAAGLSAAAVLAEAGIRRTVVLESEPVAGGSSMISGGLWAVSGTEMQRSLGIQDSDERFRADILEVGRHFNRIEVVDAFMRENRRQYTWARRTLGVEPREIVPGAGIRRAHAFEPKRVIAALLRKIRSEGVELRMNTRAEALTTDVTGRVTGCTVRTADGFEDIRARYGVVIASGGFSCNRALLASFSPRMRYVSTIAAQGCRGDGLLMALKLQAGLADTDFLEASYAFILNPSNGVEDMSLLPYYGALIVNRDARRFTDESLPYKQIAKAVLEQSGAKSWIVFDERVRRLALNEALDRHLWEPVSRGIIPNYVFAGRSLREAAARAGLDPVELQNTVDAYNRDVRANRHPRGMLSVGDGGLLTLSEPPFFIMPACAALLGTYCGLAIDREARVLRRDGTVIPRLRAAGEVTGGFHGASFIMGTAFAKAMTFGRIAALSIAEEAGS